MVINRQRDVRISVVALQRFLSRVRRMLKVNGRDCTVCFVTSKEMARLNWTFRGQPGPTDVLSFPAASLNGGPRTPHRAIQPQAWQLKSSAASGASPDSYLGDIAIAPGVAHRNAKKFGRTLESELRILILHGVLHLMGYDHETDSGQMERYERKLRRSLNLEPATASKARG